MTKSELISLLRDLPDEAQVFIGAAPRTNAPETLIADIAGCWRCGDVNPLAEPYEIEITEADGPDYPAFGVIITQVEYLPPRKDFNQ